LQLAAAEDELWPRGFGAWIKVGVVYQRTHQKLAALLRPLDLTVAQFDAIANLYVKDGVSQQELATQLLVTKGNVTGLVTRLEDHGLVERRADSEDRRTNRLHLTREGRRVAQRALVIQRDLVESMMQGLDAAEREQLRALLDRLAEQLG
jgi:MarR family transcriptional regulator, organic hydroperoxide resistance regulator